MDIGEGDFELRVNYTSEDGITYTKTEGDSDYELPCDISVEEYEKDRWNNVIGQFIKILGNEFGGLFKYTNKYILAPNQFTLKGPNELLPGKIGMGRNGVVIGDDTVYQEHTLDALQSIGMTQDNDLYRSESDNFMYLEKDYEDEGMKTKQIWSYDLAEDLENATDIMRINQHMTDISGIDTSQYSNMYVYVSEYTINFDGNTLYTVLFDRLKSLIDIYEINTSMYSIEKRAHFEEYGLPAYGSSTFKSFISPDKKYIYVFEFLTDNNENTNYLGLYKYDIQKLEITKIYEGHKDSYNDLNEDMLRGYDCNFDFKNERLYAQYANYNTNYRFFYIDNTGEVINIKTFNFPNDNRKYLFTNKVSTISPSSKYISYIDEDCNYCLYDMTTQSLYKTIEKIDSNDNVINDSLVFEKIFYVCESDDNKYYNILISSGKYVVIKMYSDSLDSPINCLINTILADNNAHMSINYYIDVNSIIRNNNTVLIGGLLINTENNEILLTNMYNGSRYICLVNSYNTKYIEFKQVNVHLLHPSSSCEIFNETFCGVNLKNDGSGNYLAWNKNQRICGRWANKSDILKKVYKL